LSFLDDPFKLMERIGGTVTHGEAQAKEQLNNFQ
jgi:hypothetical protein